MYEFLSKRGSIIALIVSLVIVVIFFVMVGSGAEALESTPKDQYKYVTTFDFGLYATFVLLIICIATVVLFSIYHIFTNFKRSLGSILGLTAVVILFFILYSMAEPAGSEKLSLLMQKFDVSDSLGKAISGGLWTTIIMGGLALVSIVLAEIWNAFK